MSRLNERIENFNRAFDIFNEAVNAYNQNKENILTHMALVQAYEVCFELSWKVLKDYLAENGILVYLPKQVIKEAFNKNVISDGQIWIDMLDARNATSHEYKMDKINLILEKISTSYFKELQKFSNWLVKLNG
ncbi:MAG: nucleotidyltransferase substrate binding protein [Fusobacterium sp.]|nr:nucleotidyltransferase substrate binding protein [Fusobacterium sp.]